MPNQNVSALAENIIEIYSKYGREWTQLRGEFLYEKAWLDCFLALLPPSPDILDLGCGSGKPIASYCIENAHNVTGVDSSAVMIEMAKDNFPEQNWLLQDMRLLDLERKFEGILAWDSFFHLKQDDQRKMFAIFQKHSKAGTALIFTTGPEQGEAVGDMFGEALYHASLSQEEYRALLKSHGFEVVKMIANDEECTGHTVWLAQKVK